MTTVNMEKMVYNEYGLATRQTDNQDRQFKQWIYRKLEMALDYKEYDSGLWYGYIWWPKESLEEKRANLLPRTDIFKESCRDGGIITDNFPSEHDLDTAITNAKTSIYP